MPASTQVTTAGSPGGSVGQLQFNAGGSLGGIAGSAVTASPAQVKFTNTYNNSSATIVDIYLNNIYTQSGSAGSMDLLINRTETSLGSSSHYFIACQVAGVF